MPSTCRCFPHFKPHSPHRNPMREVVSWHWSKRWGHWGRAQPVAAWTSRKWGVSDLIVAHFRHLSGNRGPSPQVGSHCGIHRRPQQDISPGLGQHLTGARREPRWQHGARQARKPLLTVRCRVDRVHSHPSKNKLLFQGWDDPNPQERRKNVYLQDFTLFCRTSPLLLNPPSF